MEDSELLRVFDKEVRQECTWTRMRRDVQPGLVRHVLNEGTSSGGLISWTDIPADSVDGVIAEQIHYFQGLNADFEWKLYDYDQPADLGVRLLAHGFKKEDPEALMVGEIHSLPQSYWDLDTSMVQRISTPEEVDEILAMEKEVWDEDVSGFAKGMKYDLLHYPEIISVYVVRQDGRVVSAAWTHYLVPTSFASLWGGSTLRQYRRRGYYTALLAARAREARQRGYRLLQVDASPDSQPILAKHGFRCLAYSTPYEWEPANAAKPASGDQTQ